MTLRNNRHNGHNNFGLVCAASTLAVACLFSVTTASAASLPADQVQGQENAQPVSNAAAMPDNPGTPLPGAVSNAIPDDAVAVSNDLAVTPDGTLKDVATGATVTDQALVGTPQTAPDPLAKTDGKKFIPVPIGDVKEALKDQGADSASTDSTNNTDNSANAARLTSAVAYTASTSATASTASANPRTRLASLPDNDSGAHWGQYNGSQAFFESDGTLFAQQAKGVVDVSEWQGDNIDWAKAKAAGVQGAIIRLSFGWNNRFDKYARRNISECKRLGIPFGVYWYSYAENATDSGHEGADMAAKLSEVGVKPGDMQYPAFYDLEKWTWRATRRQAIRAPTPAWSTHGPPRCKPKATPIFPCTRMPAISTPR
jgi:hypothetical protein